MTTTPGNSELEEVEAKEPPKGKSRLWGIVRQLLPWVFTFGLVYYLFTLHSPAEAWEALKEVNLAVLLPFWAFAVFVVFLADTYCLTQLFSRLHQKVSFQGLLPVKGASYLLNIINYNAAQGGIALFVSRKTEAPFLQVVSSMLFLIVIDMVVLMIYMGLGLAFLSSWSESPYQLPVMGIAGAIAVGYIGTLIYWNGGFNFLILGRLRSWAIFHAFRQGSLKDHGILVSMRFAFMSLYFVTQYVSLSFFDIHIPLLELCMYNAVLTIVGTLPISVPGLGATQIVMIALYAPYASEAQVLAYSTAIAFVFILVRMAVGYRYVGQVTRDW